MKDGDEVVAHCLWQTTQLVTLSIQLFHPLYTHTHTHTDVCTSSHMKVSKGLLSHLHLDGY